MSGLATGGFDEFVEAVHGHPPFPWQRALLERVVDPGRGWPEVIDVPTGLGKTSVLDVAVFARAVGVEGAPLRTFLVIDRRVVVDQAYEHAEALRRSLDGDPEAPVLREVAAALRPPTAGGRPSVPLVVGRMRGGIDWSWRWLDRPDQPAIVVGTVDQLGSRFFFRGYGVGEHLRSIDAAMVGTDSLVVVDEAHLAEPLLVSARRALHLGRPEGVGEAVAVPRLVTMSATAPAADDVHSITAADRQHAEASRRLGAAKRLHLVEVEGATGRNGPDRLAGVLVRLAQHLADDGADVVGVVVNTVAAARRCFELLASHAPDTVVLLTGRQRPVDRDLLMGTWLPRLRAGRQRHTGPHRFVVATQTVEVGADLDLGGLVTESASLDAVVQRLGRLNRRGRWDAAPAVVVHPAGLDDDDPVYGAARPATWAWLRQQVAPVPIRATARGLPDLGDGADASPGAWAERLQSVDPSARSAMRVAPATVPVLFRTVLDRWVRTSPEPASSPPVAPFLHGIDRGQPEVQLLWRSTPEGPDVIDALRASIDLVPPSTGEMVAVPLVAVRMWARGAGEQGAVADVEGAGPADADDRDAGPGSTPPQAAARRSGRGGGGGAGPAPSW